MVKHWFTKGVPGNVFFYSLVGTVGGATFLVKDIFGGAKFKKDVDCKGKVAVVTGGNSGIGKATAKELAKRGAVVFLVCRDKDRCAKARKEIVLATRNKYVYVRVCDLASLNSVHDFVTKFKEEEKRLDILINNAGVMGAPYGKTEDGFEIHLGVNHMGHFLLTNLLLDLLIKSAPSRIINVTSTTHESGKINKEDLNSDQSYNERDAYNQSKLANILFTKELAERLKDTGVTANAVHPGTSSTDLFRQHTPSMSRAFATALIKPFMWLLSKSAHGGAQTVLYAALDPDLEKVSGKYFSDCKEDKVAPHADDDATAKWLWYVSEKWTRLKDYETRKDKAVSKS